MDTIQSTVTYRDIPDFPGYRVGDDGSVWSQRSLNGKGGFTRWRKKDYKPNKFGYIRVSLMRDAKLHLIGIHRLVLLAFVGPCPKGMQACHNNGKPTDNRLENLRWDTPKGNQLDRVIHGTHMAGEKNGRAKLSDDDVISIRRIYSSGERTKTQLSEQFGVTSTMIRYIVKGDNWSHLQ